MSSATLRRYRDEVDAFAAALYRLLSVMRPEEGAFGSAPHWVPQPGREAEAARLRFEVDRLAGRAAYGLTAAGSFVEYKPRGTFQTVPVGPAQAWSTILDWDPMFDIGTIFACCTQALGVLEMKAEEAEEYERQKVRRFVHALARLTGSGLRPVVRWTARGVGTVAIAGATYFLGWT